MGDTRFKLRHLDSPVPLNLGREAVGTTRFFNSRQPFFNIVISVNVRVDTGSC